MHSFDDIFLTTIAATIVVLYEFEMKWAKQKDQQYINCLNEKFQMCWAKLMHERCT